MSIAELIAELEKYSDKTLSVAIIDRAFGRIDIWTSEIESDEHGLFVRLS